MEIRQQIVDRFEAITRRDEKIRFALEFANGALGTLHATTAAFPGYQRRVEITGTEGALVLDDTQRDNWLNTMKDGQVFPMSTMPGEQVGEVFAGGMGPETIHFLEACIRNTPVMVTPESARRVMETYSAADLSAFRNEPVDLPLSNETISQVAEFKEQNRSGANPG